VRPADQAEQFCMTVFALRLSSFNNGVSRLHGAVSREMWKELWPHFPVEDAPITHITNGVHIPSWISMEMAYLYYRYLGPEWMEDPDSQAVWERVVEVPDSELWRAHERRRARLISFVRRRLTEQLSRRGASPETLMRASEIFNTEALTVVFARRFATYKRAVMIFSDLDRLERILCDPQRPVQLIFAGKAHPKDAEGKEFIRRVVEVAGQPRFRDHIVFLEDYDINVARYLVQGADVWLNTPRRPLEACGTSGMKAAANGCLNLSILDGWWDEGFQPGLGWAIGSGEEYDDPHLQDQLEALAVYQLLESEVVPLFYQREADELPRGWVRYMKQSLSRLCPQFNTHRMLEDYTDLAYLPAARSSGSLAQKSFAKARDLGSWSRRIMENWSQVQVLEVSSPNQGPLTFGQEVEVRARVRLGALAPADVACDVYFGVVGPEGDYLKRRTLPMHDTGGGEGEHEFSGTITCQFNGQLGLSVRVVPFHPQLTSRYALGLAAWG
jgi:starch phosphorylase